MVIWTTRVVSWSNGWGVTCLTRHEPPAILSAPVSADLFTRAAPGGGAAEATQLGFDRDALKLLYTGMLITRRVEPAQAGSEATAIALAAVLGHDDVVSPTERDLGFWLARGHMPSEAVTRPQMVDAGILRASAEVMVGCALAFAVKSEARVAVACLSDSDCAHGAVHEAMNVASTRRLPVVFVIENGQAGTGTFACATLAARGSAYGIPGVVCDGTDILAVYRELRLALERARSGGGPTLLELITLTAQAPVAAEVREAWRALDPVDRMQTLLRDQANLTDEEHAAIEREVDAAVSDAS